MAKKRLVKDYEALSEDIVRQVKMAYPTGFAAHLVTYTDKEGKKVSALPFETDDIYYLIRMTVLEAKRIISEDDDFNEDGILRKEFVEAESEDDFENNDDDDLDDADDDSHIIRTRRRGDDMDDIADDNDY